jgi:hypothetical protein
MYKREWTYGKAYYTGRGRFELGPFVNWIMRRCYHYTDKGPPVHSDFECMFVYVFRSQRSEITVPNIAIFLTSLGSCCTLYTSFKEILYKHQTIKLQFFILSTNF